ncbi:hypothetical protein B0O99DRAFT_693543 [Bisporella sp. PMI_857]|nr:hypothetical protein B0O99DRAFT_693543 [Bisporella sp. PMI_857]
MFLSILRAKESISADSESTGDDIVGPQSQSPSSTAAPVGSNETIDLNLQKPETLLNSLPSIYKSDVDYGPDLGSTISSDSSKSLESATASRIDSNRVCPSENSLPGASNSLISSCDVKEDPVPESRGRSLTQVSTQSENLFDSSSPPGSPTHSDSEVTVSTEFEPVSSPTWQEFCEFPFVPSGTDNLPPAPSPIHRKKSEFRLRYKSLDIKLCLQCEVLDLPCSLYFYRNKDLPYCQQCLRNGEGFCIKQVWSRTYDERTGEKKFEYVTTERISREALDERVKELLSMKEDKVRFALPKAPVGYRKKLKNAFRYASMTDEIIDAKSEAAKAILVPQDT